MTQQQAASLTPTPQTLAFGFCTGTAPTKWLRRWETAGYPAQLAATALDLAFFEAGVDQPAPHSAATAATAEVLAAGGVCLLRTGAGEKPARFGTAELNSVLLYQEEFGVLAAKDADVVALGAIQDAAEFELVQLFAHPWHLPEFPAATPWQDPSWMPTSVTAIAQLAATGTAAALLPLPLARQIADKKQHRVLPVAPGLVAPRAAIWACWMRSKDSPLVQDFIGVLRGRKRGSSRDATAAAGSVAAPKAAGKPTGKAAGKAAAGAKGKAAGKATGKAAGSKTGGSKTAQHKTRTSKTPGGKTTRGKQQTRRRSKRAAG